MGIFGIFSGTKTSTKKAIKHQAKVQKCLTNPTKPIYHLGLALEDAIRTNQGERDSGHADLALLLAVNYVWYARYYAGIAVEPETVWIESRGEVVKDEYGTPIGIEPSWTTFSTKAIDLASQVREGEIGEVTDSVVAMSREIGSVTVQEAYNKKLLRLLNSSTEVIGVPFIPVYEVVPEGWTLAELYTVRTFGQQPMTMFFDLLRSLPGYSSWAARHPELP